MKKIIKKITTCILAAMVTFCAAGSVYASQDITIPELYIDGYKVNDSMINIYVNQNQPDTSWINTDNSKVMFGSKELGTAEIKNFNDAPEKITYKCVIDVSGSMSQERIDIAKEIIKNLAAAKRAEDNITITAMGNDLIRSDFLTDPMQISDLVSGVSRTREDTNLYYGIVEEIKELQTNDMVGTKKCLILFSDGADDQATGITREEASKAVEDSHIPVFTVAMPKNASNKGDQEMAKILGSFARLSSGGVHYYTPDFEKSELPSIGSSIAGRINNSLVFSEDIRELDTDEKAHELKITVKTAEGNAEDVINVAESDIKRIKEIQEELKEPEKAEEPVSINVSVQSEEVVEEETFKILGLDPLLFFIILGAVLLLIAAVVIFIILRSRKMDENEEYDSQEDDMGKTFGVDDIGVTGGVSDLSGVTMPVDGYGGSPTVGLTAPSSSKAYHMVLTRMGKSNDENNTYKFDLTDKYTVGRSSSKSRLAFPDDTALSGLHCTFYVKDKRIYLRDEKSTNGTFVNGVPITGPFAIEKDDTLIIGSNEYRVTWK